MLLLQSSNVKFDFPTICSVVNLLLEQSNAVKLSGNDEEESELIWLFLTSSIEMLLGKDGKEVNLFEPQYRFFKAVLLDTLSEVKELFWHSSMNILVQLVTLRLVKLLLVQSKRVMLLLLMSKVFNGLRSFIVTMPESKLLEQFKDFI